MYSGPILACQGQIWTPVPSYLRFPLKSEKKKLHKICDLSIFVSDYLFLSLVYLRNKSWKPECVVSFNMDWWILVFYPEPEARDKIY